MRGFRESLAGLVEPDMATALEVMEANSMLQSLYRQRIMDADDRFERVNVQAGGLHQLMIEYRRTAAVAEMPMTQFSGESSAGLNSTGVSDERGYAMRVAQLQERMFTPNLRRLDPILASDAGLADPPDDWEWLSILDLGDAEKVKLAAGKVSLGKVGLDAGLLEAKEIRAMLDGDDVIGNLEIDPPWLEDPLERREGEEEGFGGAGERPRG